jgi:hypothetical protein
MDAILLGGWAATITPNDGAAYQGGGRRRAGSVHVCARRGGQIINLDIMPDELAGLDLDAHWATITTNRSRP